MIIVTGGAGFIGSNLVQGLNARGEEDIIVVDDLTDGTKFKNLVDARIADYLDKDVFLQMLLENVDFSEELRGVFHLGACSDTTEWNGKFMMENNFEYSKYLFHYCQEREVPFIYASSAAVYGNHTVFAESPANEEPLNVYGYSKLLFDQYLRRQEEFSAQVVGLRYFNVYGPREQHKGKMASVAFHLNQQCHENGVVKLFEGCEGYGDGEQRRDFVYVDDVVAVNLFFMDNPQIRGIFNVGTGRSQPFNDVAKAVLAEYPEGRLQYVPFPEHLKGHYQSFTEADISALRRAGYDQPFLSVEEGVARYLKWLKKA